MNEKEQLYEKLKELREQVKNNKNALEYYEYLREINRNDAIYGWIFTNHDILNETLEDLDMYQDSYTRDILRTYIGELELILYKINL